jgi:hypothetical protein
MATNPTPAPATLPDDNPAFDNAYWAHQPPEVQALRNIPDPSSAALGLAAKGFTIDVPIMIWKWDAWKVMRLREQYGYTWVPSALQPPIQEPPGIVVPGLQPYDPNNPPPGSIKVSLNVADYPAYPTPPAPTPDYVGPLNFGNVYFSIGNDPIPDGATVTDSRGTFLKHRQVVQTPFGPMVNGWYTLVTPA